MKAKRKKGLVFLGVLVRAMLSLRYKVKLIGSDVLKADSIMLFLPNHQALLDPMIVGTQIYKFSAVSPAISDKYYNVSLFKGFLKMISAIPVSDIEAGNRDVNVLKKVTESSLNALSNRFNIMIYPAGQLSSQGFEKIRNKQGVYKLISLLPDNIKVIGVRTNGLWGSMWSKGKTGKTPDFLKCFLKGIGILLINLILFTPRRKITIEFQDLTQLVRENSKKERSEFNKSLEDFFNRNGEEELSKIKYQFLL